MLAVSFLARTAVTAAVMALTMYVVLGANLSYVAAGGVAAALTTGLALGGPLLGRRMDRRGPRAVLHVTVVAQALFWASVPWLPYPVLVGAALAAGVTMVPAQAVTRQAITAMTTPAQRRAAFALESVQGELSYMIGPAVVMLCAATVHPNVAVWGTGAVVVAGGAGIALLDPPLRDTDEAPADAGRGTPRRERLHREVIAVLTMALGTTVLLSGVDLAIVATLEEVGQVSRGAVVIAVFGLTSAVGGLLYGLLPRESPTWLMLGLLGLATTAAGFAEGWLWLCVAVTGAGVLTAPTLTAVSHEVSRLAPGDRRGEVTGLQSSAQSAGFALGAPLVGAVIDGSAPPSGFAAAGLAGLCAALAGCLLSRRRRPRRLSARADTTAVTDHAP
ncbi:MFS transporter [Streptomyces sp. NPDC050703]|uniref:MFS transporter n=1 Tax=Streptomyces sp. NPDC050703 TaxID=3157218 RepID=UPI0034351D0B